MMSTLTNKLRKLKWLGPFAVIGLTIVASGSFLRPCRERGPLPDMIFGSNYVIVAGAHKLYLGQSYDYSHEGFWFSSVRPLYINSEGALFLVHFEEPHEKLYTCTQFVTRPAGPSAWLSFTTHDPDALRPLLFRPEDLSGKWMTDTYRVQTANLPVHREPQWPFVDQIRATISAVPISPTDLDLPGYWPPHSALQVVYVYANETEAVLAFVKDPSPYLDWPTTEDYQPLLKNRLALCTQSEAYRCTFIGQYGQYVVDLNAEIDDKYITMRDWAELVKVIQERLIKQVERATTTTP